MPSLYSIVIQPSSVAYAFTKHSLFCTQLFLIKLPLTIMSAVIDAVSEALGTEAGHQIFQRSTHPSQPHNAGTEITTDNNPDIPLRSPVRGTDVKIGTRPIEDNDNESPPSSTRVDTPHPARNSTSSRTARFSGSTPRPFPSTLTESIVPSRSDLSSHVAFHTDVGDIDCSVSDYGQANSELNIPSGNLDPVSPVPNTSGESGLTPSSRSYRSYNTSSSTPAELLLGPQSLPFILRRRGISDVTPSRVENPHHAPLYKNVTRPPVILRSGSNEDQGSEKENIDVKAGVDSVHEQTVQETVKSTKDLQSQKLSSWRQEQLRIARIPRLMPGTTPRPIATLYGPLSLPYARNPSGVDATVADESAYLSHIFGLRPAPNPKLASECNYTVRSVSSGTTSSGTQTTRSTSGSSVVNTSGKTSNNTSILTEGSSYTSLGGTHHARPMVMRDPHQNIGIKKTGMGGKDMEGEVGFQAGSSDLRSLAKNEASSDSEQHIGTNPVNHSIRDLKRRASESSLLTPSTGTQALGLSKSHADLRGFTSLSPIPGSPAEPKDPFHVLYAQAITSAGGDPSMAQLSSPSADPSTERDLHHVFSTPVRLPGYLPVTYDPTTLRYEFATASESRSKSPSPLQYAPVSSTPQVVQIAQATPPQPSKADTSENWRKRDESNQNIAQMFREQDQCHATTRAPNKTNQYMALPSEGTVMTIDNLFDKFSHSSPHTGKHVPNVAFNPPLMRGTSASVKKPGLKASKSSPEPPQSSSVTILGETTKTLNVNAAPYSPSKADRSASKKGPSVSPQSAPSAHGRLTNAVTAKGTPGAGKLLRRITSDSFDSKADETPTPQVLEAQVKREGRGKGKAVRK
ncbi:hypothetical protein IAR55_003941 [Kwoniella newhampshirensis]|uniref:Uncharacterized protein n=1 Tax=Kwoniella newhampshirensis TaxID=1651941 RepID=A0AAW0YYH3_9TREE